jgi:hypothetical protein
MPQLDGLPIFEERRRIVKVAQREGIEYVALAIGGFFDFIFTPFWGWDVEKREATIWGTPETNFACMSRHDVGKLIDKICKMEKLPANDMVVTAEVLSWKDMIKTWERLIGAKVNTKSVSTEAIKKTMESSRDMPAAYAVAQIQYAVAAGGCDLKPMHNKDFADIKLASFEENLCNLLASTKH